MLHPVTLTFSSTGLMKILVEDPSLADVIVRNDAKSDVTLHGVLKKVRSRSYVQYASIVCSWAQNLCSSMKLDWTLI